MSKPAPKRRRSAADTIARTIPGLRRVARTNGQTVLQFIRHVVGNAVEAY